MQKKLYKLPSVYIGLSEEIRCDSFLHRRPNTGWRRGLPVASGVPLFGLYGNLNGESAAFMNPGHSPPPSHG